MSTKRQTGTSRPRAHGGDPPLPPLARKSAEGAEPPTSPAGSTSEASSGVTCNPGCTGPGCGCRAVTVDGVPCRAPVRAGAVFCGFHDPEHADAMRRGRRHGARERNRAPSMVASVEADLPVASARDVVRLMGDTVNRVRKGTLDPRVANAVGYLASVALRALEVGEFEGRLERVEAAIAASASVSEAFWSGEET